MAANIHDNPAKEDVYANLPGPAGTTVYDETQSAAREEVAAAMTSTPGNAQG